MFSFWAYILLGNDKTGKTTFQRLLTNELCLRNSQNLKPNFCGEIQHPRMPSGLETISVMNNSYQEKKHIYNCVDDFFKSHFKEADICILSSHVDGNCIAEIEEMMANLRSRAFNVAAVFFDNAWDSDCAKIANLNWDEKLWVQNTPLRSPDAIDAQLSRLAREFASLLIARSALQ